MNRTIFISMETNCKNIYLPKKYNDLLNQLSHDLGHSRSWVVQEALSQLVGTRQTVVQNDNKGVEDVVVPRDS